MRFHNGFPSNPLGSPRHTTETFSTTREEPLADLPEWAQLTGDVPPAPEWPYPEASCDWAALHHRPVIDPSAWVAPGAVVLGRVRLMARSSIWYGCVVRGDSEYIEVGTETNVQDGAVLHVDEGHPCILGNRVTLGHGAIVHASVVEDEAMIAISATVLSRCVIGRGALVAAGSMVKEGTVIPPGTVWAGCPARQIKIVDEPLRARMTATWQHYVNQAVAFAHWSGDSPTPPA